MISSRRDRTSRLVIPRIAPFRYVFSIPVSSPWNPVPTSSSEPTRPRVRQTPSVGVVMPLMTLSSVLLPAPLEPMIPSAVPSSTLNDTSRSDQISRTSRSGRAAEPAGEAAEGVAQVGALAVVLAEAVALADGLELDDGAHDRRPIR